MHTIYMHIYIDINKCICVPSIYTYIQLHSITYRNPFIAPIVLTTPYPC